LINDIILLGINTNYHVGQNSAQGYLPVEDFDKELLELNVNDDKHLILAFHHNISGTYEDKISGQWDLTNRKDIIPIFEKHKVKCIFHGNEHTPKSGKLVSSEIYVSDSGALAGITPSGSFKIYEINLERNSIELKNNIFQLRKTNAIDESNFGEWGTVLQSEVRTEIESFNIFIGMPELIDETLEIPSQKSIKEVQPKSKNRDSKSCVIYENKVIQTKLYQIVKEKKLFHSGHFHWSESSRAHNWIDIAKLLENHDDLYFVKKSIVDVIESQSLNDDCDLMIGLGAEGNIISSKASIQFEMPHVSLPYSYRYDESHEYERQINYANSRGNFKTVMIISDVINDGRTLRKLIGFHEKEFFEKVERVIVISLFYTGQESINTNILNYDNLSEKHNIEDEYRINCIEFYAIKQLRVEKCPYGSHYKEECFIYKDDLNCVHLFFNEDTEVDVT